MSALILAVAVASVSPSKSVSPSETAEQLKVESLGEAEARLRREVQTGSLLVTQGDCLAIRVYTQSPYTHVAAVVIRNGQPFVYDSANGVGSRCLTLKNYIVSQSPSEIHLFQPRREFNPARRRKFETSLDGQLGRPYGIRHHLTGERAAGLHCSEYVTDALQYCGVIRARRPSRVSPASLVLGITQHDLYLASLKVRVQPPQSDSVPATESWCSQLWNDTRACTAECYRKTKSWVFCQ
ncbi:MAG: hypothetical protein VB858_06805 [Planctomycetaceae bacterium]